MGRLARDCDPCQSSSLIYRVFPGTDWGNRTKNNWRYSYILTDPYREGNGDKKQVEAGFKALSKAGYEGVELPGLHWFKTVDDLKGTMKLAKSYGLEVSETKHTHDFIKRDAKERRSYIDDTKNALKLAAGAGLDYVQVFTGPGFAKTPMLWLGPDIQEGEAWGYVWEAFDELVPYAEKLGVYLAFEPVYNMVVREFYTLKYFMDHYKSKNVVVNFDASHYNLYREDLRWVINQLGSSIQHVHLHESVGKPGYPAHNGEDFNFPMPGEGTVDWTGHFRGLKDIGYKGFLSFEFGGKWLKLMGYSFEEIVKLKKTNIDALIAMA